MSNKKILENYKKTKATIDKSHDKDEQGLSMRINNYKMNISSDCCKYLKEKKAKAAALKKKKKLRKAEKINENSFCQENMNNKVESVNQECLNMKKRVISKLKLSKVNSNTINRLSEVKPSIAEREKLFKMKDLQQKNINVKLRSTRGNEGSESEKLKKKSRKSWCKDTLSEVSIQLNKIMSCDSICSFDSIINLAGIRITEEEMEKIERKRNSHQELYR